MNEPFARLSVFQTPEQLWSQNDLFSRKSRKNHIHKKEEMGDYEFKLYVMEDKQ